jgi:hypothetical protein
MKSVRVCLLAVIALAMFSAVSRAQVLTNGAQGCRVSNVDRTVTFCAPGEGGTITNQFHPFFFITDSLPYEWCIYEDGINIIGCENGPPSSDFGWNSIFSLGAGWHRFSVVVFDTAGVFKNWLRFRVNGDPECTVPTTDRTIFICTPLAAANVISPIHIAAVANSTSVPATVMVAYVDGQQVQVAQDAAESGVSSQHGTTISTYLPLPLGTHRVSVQVVDQNNNKFATPEQTFTVVAAPQQD